MDDDGDGEEVSQHTLCWAVEVAGGTPYGVGVRMGRMGRVGRLLLPRVVVVDSWDSPGKMGILHLQDVKKNVRKSPSNTSMYITEHHSFAASVM